MWGKHKSVTITDYRNQCSYCHGVGFSISDKVIRCVTCNACWAHFDPEFDNDG